MLRPGFRCGRWVAALSLLPLAGGCARRSVQAGPGTTGAATWLLVGIAAGAAIALVATLVLPTGARPRFAPLVLAVETGGVVVGGALLVGAALRNRWLLDRAADQEHAAALVRLSNLDGRQASFFYAVAGLLAILTVLLAVVLGLTTRFAADEDELERWLATAVLAVQCLASAVAWGLLAWGRREPGLLLAALALPLLIAATAACWPREGGERHASATTDL